MESIGTKDHENVGNSSHGRSQGVPKLQGTHGASRGHLCDSTAFLSGEAANLTSQQT